MSTLQISLAVAGGVVLAGIVAHTAWSSRKNAPRLPEPSVLGETPPALDVVSARLSDLSGPSSFADAGGGLSAPMDSSLGGLSLPAAPFFASDEMGLIPPMAGDKRAVLDALADVICNLSVDVPVRGELALAALPGTRRAGAKLFAIEGQNSRTLQWEHPIAGQKYSAFQAGVQMASRTGALNDIEYSEFAMKVQTFADAINAMPEFPDMREAVARARELDNFASGHDAQLSFRVRALRTAWSPGYIQQCAARLGFVSVLVPGRLVLPSQKPGSAPILSLVFDSHAALAQDPDESAVRELVLNLEVAHVDRHESPFVRLRECSLALAEAMDGRVTDEDGMVLSGPAMDDIALQLEHLYDTLEAREFTAGSALARRVFS